MRTVLIGEVNQDLVAYANGVSLSRRHDPSSFEHSFDNFARWLLSDQKAQTSRVEALEHFCLHPNAPDDLVAESIGLVIWIAENYWQADSYEGLPLRDRLKYALVKIKERYRDKSYPMMVLADLAIKKVG